MKRNRDRSAQLVAKRDALKAKRVALHGYALLHGHIKVNAALLRPDNSYGFPDYVERGYYIDRSFTCKDCGRQDVWTATQQKWWYETAKGGVWTAATRCRLCRRRERERRNEARRVHLEGVARRRTRKS